MTINPGVIVERALEGAFARALRRVIQAKTETVFAKALAKTSPVGKKLEDKIEEAIRRFIQEGPRNVESMTNRPATLGEQS